MSKKQPFVHDIDYGLVERLSTRFATLSMIAYMLGVSPSTVQNRMEVDERFRTARERGLEQGKQNIVETQLAVAMDPDHKYQGQMLKHVGEVHCGQALRGKSAANENDKQTFIELIQGVAAAKGNLPSRTVDPDRFMLTIEAGSEEEENEDE